MAYGLWLYKEIQGKHLVRLEIKKKDYQGQAIEIDALGKDSIILSMDGSNITDPIIGSTLSFAIIDSGQINTSDFFTPDATLYAVELYLDGTLEWSGYLTPDSYQENLSYRDTISLVARDNLGRLEEFKIEEDQGLQNIEILIDSFLAEVGCPQVLNWQCDKVATEKGEGVEIDTPIRDMWVNTRLWIGKTYRDAVEDILYGLGCQMRFRGLNNLLILNLSDLSTIQEDSAIFIEKSGHKEILPAWKNVTITQDYGLIENFFDGVLTEKESGSSTFYNPSEQVPTKWEGNLNFQNQYGWNTGIEDNQQESIYPALHEEDQDVLNGDYRAIYKTPIKATNATLSITMSLNNTLRRLRNVVFNSVSNLFVPQGKEKYQITFSFQVALRTPNGKVYIMTSNDWVDEQSLDFNHSFARWIKFLMPECVMADEGTWNKDQEVSIFVNSIPYDGELLLYIYPVLWGEDGTNDGYSLAGKIRDIKIAFSNDIGQQSARATINDKHNITSEIALTIGQVPSGKGDYKAYAGGLFASDGLPIYGFKRRESDIITYNLMELVGREHIHYNKDNYTILSGRMMGDVSFGDNIAYKGRKYTLISASYSVISGILDVTSMQEVRDYQVAELTIIDSPLESTSGSKVGSGNNEVIQFSDDAGNAKRLYELQDAADQDQEGAFIIIDKSSMDSAKKLPISAISSALNKAFKVHYNNDGSIKSIEALANFWTKFGITAGGEGTGSGGGGGGLTSFSVIVNNKTYNSDNGVATITEELQPKITAANPLPYALVSGTPTLGSLAYKNSLAASDVPNLDWSKITSGKPTTLAGYGITDALSVNGGILIGNLNIDTAIPQTVYSINNDDVAIVGYRGGIGAWLYNDISGSYISVADDGTPIYNGYTLLHSGNIGSYALKTDGSNNMSRYITIDTDLTQILFLRSSSGGNRGDLGADTNTGELIWRNLLKGESWRYVAFTDSNVASADYATNAGNAEKVAGVSVTSGDNKPWGTIPAITPGGYMDVGRHFEFHYDNTTGSDFSTILMCTGNYSNFVYLPSASGTLALLTDNVASATKLQTSTGTDIVNINDSGLLLIGGGSAKWTTVIDGTSIHLRAKDYAYGLFINENGNVCIGTTTDYGYKLAVTGGISAEYVRVSNGNQYCGLMPNNRITGSGNADRLWLYNDSELALYGSNIQLWSNTIVTGNFSATGAITAGTASDRRLKNNICTINHNQAIEVLMALNPITFIWNKKATELGGFEGLSQGFIAQEYESLIPNSGRAIWEDYRAIDYTMAIPYIVSVEQNHEQRIRQLEDELKRLRREYYGIQ